VINNLYGMGTSVEQASGEPELYKRACSYRMHSERVDGNDVLTVREAAARLLTRAREESEAALLETTTYRFRGHSVADAGKVYRTAEEITSWRERDPITRYVEILREHDLLGDEELDGMRTQVADEVSEAIREAAAAPTPDPAELYENVYGDEHWRDQFARMNTAAPFGERVETRSWQR
jgi:pyruvate dehydrogenase E1 component alpha subunit